MTKPLTDRNSATPESEEVEAAQDAELAALIRQLAAKRPEIVMGWTPPPSLVPAPPPVSSPSPSPGPRPARRRVPHPLPWPRLRDPFAPHPVTGRTPTREDFPVDRATTDSIAVLRAVAAGTHRSGDHWPAHATDAYRARKTRPSRLHRAVRALTRALRTSRTAAGHALALCALASVTFLTTLLLTHLPLSH